MCELLNRIWSRPRGEWTRVLRRELPALAAEIVEELLHGIPGFSTLTDDNDAIDDELLRQCVEEALLTALGYRDARGCHSGKEPEQHEDRQQGRHVEQHEQQSVDLEPGPDERVCASEEQHERASEIGAEVRQYGGQHGGQHSGPHGGQHGGPHGGRPGRPGGDRARQDLFKALTDDRAPSESSLAELAEAAGWPLPVAVRAIVPATPGEAQQLAAVLDDALPGMFAGRPCLLVPSPDPDTRAPLELPLRGRFTAVGHAVPLRDTASSLRWALRLLALTPARAGLEARAVFVDDHLSTLLLLQDEPLAHALAARWLRPLADLTPRQSERLEVTLLAWLEGGGAPEAAKALSVHPQTVRYRMRQLEKLFGPGLRDPRTRFELEMALRSRRLMAQVRRQHSRVGRRTARVVTADFTPVVVGRMARVNGL
ncbi:helix-turn-helix domain-containing protein [Streptomyces sp. NPDC048269]|uniref:PucR family transcriptional regulator n=1 Tax=Streptomyces sp. NPDC048269 TaxID=3155753 RepID=UPI00343D2B5E